MNAVPAMIQHDLNQETIDEIFELRLIRLGIAENQLANLSDTAKSLTKLHRIGQENNELFLHQLKTELVKKITMFKERLSNKEILFPDEIAFFLEIARDQD